MRLKNIILVKRTGLGVEKVPVGGGWGSVEGSTG